MDTGVPERFRKDAIGIPSVHLPIVFRAAWCGRFRAVVNAWQSLVGAAVGLVLVWVAMVIALFVVARREEDPAELPDMLRLIPDVVRLLRRLAKDPDVPHGVRWGLLFLVVYLLLPIDLVPDFIPVVGWVDDAVLVALGLRWVVRAAGTQALHRHWTGTQQGLALVKRVARIEE